MPSEPHGREERMVDEWALECLDALADARVGRFFRQTESPEQVVKRYLTHAFLMGARKEKLDAE